MDRIREFLSRRIYGVPVGVFAVIAAAVILYFALRMKKSVPEETETETTDETGGDADPFGGDQANPVFQASPTTPTVMATPTADTNDLWAKRARDYLTGTLGQSPLKAQSLVYKYLASQTLNTQEQGLIDKVLAYVGYPPEPPDPPTDDVSTPDDGQVVSDPAPAPTPATTPTGPGSGMPATKQGEPPLMHTVQNARDNGPGELARLYFGSNSPTIVAKIEAANVGKGSGPWSPGSKIKIPANVEPGYFTATQNTKGLNEIAAKNGVSKDFIKALNPGMDFPVKVGTKVRVR